MSPNYLYPGKISTFTARSRERDCALAEDLEKKKGGRPGGHAPEKKEKERGLRLTKKGGELPCGRIRKKPPRRREKKESPLEGPGKGNSSSLKAGGGRRRGGGEASPLYSAKEKRGSDFLLSEQGEKESLYAASF